MKIWLGSKAHASSGGMYRVYDGLYTYLPDYGVEIVDKKEDADILHCHIGIWGDVPDDKPVIVSSHGMLWEEDDWGKISGKINKECLKSYRRADIVTTPSQFVARSIARYTGAKPIVAHHGIDTNVWKPQKERQNYVLWNKARSDPASSPQEMNVLARLAPDTMFYSTHGEERENVYIFGNVSPDDMREVVANAGVYLALSKESGGPCFGVLEAMASAVPVLSWNFGGTAEVIRHKETGYLAQPGNFEDLLEGLRYCQNHKEQLGTNARQTVVDRYQWKDTVLGYIKAYETALYGWNNTVSVIIPCYNLGQFLPYCLDSVLAQTYTDLEIIVIDDASTDNSWEIIQNYAEKDSRILPLQNTKNKHVSYSRNTAIKYSTGNFILPLDADDRLYPDSVELLVNEIRNKREYDIIAGKLHIYHETALEGPFQESGWPNNASLKLQLEGYNRLPYASLYRRKVFDRVGGYRTRIRNGVEDADFWTRALSLGYEATILNKPVLKYTHRDQSLGKQNDKGAAAWLDWFPYNENNSPANVTEVKSFSPPKISVVIPVGPGHEHYIQACLDSLWAQTETDWEAVVVNDTGTLLENIPGYVNYVTYQDNHGVAYARNRGVEAALSSKIIFLDVDDTLQPHALRALLAAQEYAGGWIYGDWYINKGNGTIEYSEAEDWNYDIIINRSLGPITGIYEKEHIQLVNGFTEDLPGWEDWDFHLKLLHHGICGTRLNTPLITYNMHLGWRREDNFIKRENLLQYIKDKHYDTLKDKSVACNSCGGKRTLTITQQKDSTARNTMDDLVTLKYVGDSPRRQRVKSKVQRGASYTFSVNTPIIHVFKSEVDRMMSFNIPGSNRSMFEIVQEVPSQQEQNIVVKEEPLVSQDVPVNVLPPTPIEQLDLEEHVVEKLRSGGFETISDLIEAEDGDLLTVKGIGSQRVDEIREAITQWQYSTL